jgi:hypothetical protein
VLLATQACSAFARDPVETRAVGEFTRITNSTAFNVTQGDSYSLTIDAQKNLIPFITTEVTGDTLTIGTKPNRLLILRPVTITITARALEEISLGSTGNGEVTGFSVESFKAVVGSSGNMRIKDLHVASLKAVIASSGNLTMDGSADRASVEAMSSGNCYCKNFKADRVSAEVTSAGNITIWAVDAIDASTTSSGMVYYYGDPQSVTKHATSFGKIYHRSSK